VSFCAFLFVVGFHWDKTKNSRQTDHFFSRSHHAVIRVYDDAGNVIETQQHKGDFKEC
jgi:hypothetical protein